MHVGEWLCFYGTAPSVNKFKKPHLDLCLNNQSILQSKRSLSCHKQVCLFMSEDLVES